MSWSWTLKSPPPLRLRSVKVSRHISLLLPLSLCSLALWRRVEVSLAALSSMSLLMLQIKGTSLGQRPVDAGLVVEPPWLCVQMRIGSPLLEITDLSVARPRSSLLSLQDYSLVVILKTVMTCLLIYSALIKWKRTILLDSTEDWQAGLLWCAQNTVTYVNAFLRITHMHKHKNAWWILQTSIFSKLLYNPLIEMRLSSQVSPVSISFSK